MGWRWIGEPFLAAMTFMAAVGEVMTPAVVEVEVEAAVVVGDVAVVVVVVEVEVVVIEVVVDE